MNWIKDRWSLFWDAYPRHTLTFSIVLLICGGLATSAYLQEVISKWVALPQAESMILGVPVPLLGIVLFCLVLFWVMLEAALQFKKALMPAIDVSFNADDEGLARTRTEILDRLGVKIRDDMATYVRITLTPRSPRTVKGCVVFLTKLEKRRLSNQAYTDIPLQGALPLTPAPVDVYPRVPATVDFLKVGQFDNQLGWALQTWPFRLDGVFNDNATYRFTMEVVGDDIGQSVCVEIDWRGKWDEIAGRECEKDKNVK